MIYPSQMEISSHDSLDLTSLRWGFSPVPLLPKSLRYAWRSDLLPNWVCMLSGLPIGSTIQNLGSEVWQGLKEMTPQLEHFLIFQLRSRFGGIKTLNCFEKKWPLGLRADDVCWTSRTRNCLKQNGFFANEGDLAKLTFGDLAVLEGMGAKSILDF